MPHRTHGFRGRAAALLCMLGALDACSDGDRPIPTASAVNTDATVGAADGQLADGWQWQADVVPPDDSWAWNTDAGQWQAADAGAGELGDGGALTDGDSFDSGDATDAGSGDASDVAPEPGELGGACSKNKDCKEGFCVGAGSPGAYCTVMGCATTADCQDVKTADWPVCCVGYAKQSYCLKQQGAVQCGGGDKPPGSSCASGGQSDCQTELGDWCFAVTKQAQCVKGCQKIDDAACPAGTTCNVFPGGGGCLPFTPGVVDGTSCADKPVGGCGKYAFCIENEAGDPYAYCATACQDDSECAPGLGCLKYQPGQGICHAYGVLAAGQDCAGDRFGCAKGLFCLGWGGAAAFCSATCSADVDCTGGSGALGKNAYCAKGPDSPVGACYPKGDIQNGGECGKDPLSCGAGAYCIGGYDAYDPDAYCQQSCAAAGSGACPAGSKCTAYGPEYSGCQIDGSKGQGQGCAGAPTSCQAGLLCIGASGKEICSALCTVGGAACPSGTWCAAWGAGQAGVCMPGGGLKVGAPCKGQPWGCTPGSFCQQYGAAQDAACIAECADDGSCPAGTDCKDFGQAGHYCEPVGGKTQGQACTDDANACAAGHFCVWQDSKFAMCSKQCKVDADCGASGGQKGGLWCGVGKWGGYCLPDGPLGEYGLCAGKPFACGKNLLCIGDAASNPGAFCAKECTGFAAICGAGAKCQYLGGGQAWCVKTGDLAAGMVCLEEPLSCEPAALCVKGTPAPLCVLECGPGKPECPVDSPCTWFPGSALKLCVPKGFAPFGTIRAPF